MENFKCTKCGNDYTIKYGKRNGKQCFLCKVCGCQFTGDKTFIDNEKRAAITLCCYGLSARKVSLLMLYSHVTILNWIKEFEEKRTSPNEDYFMEIDELTKFLQERTSNPQGKRFKTMGEALNWNVENEMNHIIEKVLSSLTLS